MGTILKIQSAEGDRNTGTFLDMTGTSLIYPDPIATACEIKDKIYQELGFTVNVGISTNKLLAKMASDFEKPNKVHTLFPEEIPAKMWPLPIRELSMPLAYWKS